MRITDYRLGNATILELSGAPGKPADIKLLDATIRDVTRPGRSPVVVLDLGNVPWIDAAGLGALVSAYRVARENGVALRLARAARRVSVLLVMCRLITVIETFNSIE